MEKSLPNHSSEEDEFYAVRIEKLRRLTKAGGRLLPALAGLLNHESPEEELIVGLLVGIVAQTKNGNSRRGNFEHLGNVSLFTANHSTAESEGLFGKALFPGYLFARFDPVSHIRTCITPEASDMSFAERRYPSAPPQS